MPAASLRRRFLRNYCYWNPVYGLNATTSVREPAIGSAMTPKEVEIKLAVAPAALADLEQVPLIHSCEAPSKRTQEVSVYFDTDKQAVRKAGLTLRVRRIGDRYIQTIKATANGSLFERDEWECEIEDGTPDLRAARDTALAPLLGRKFRRQLKPMFETRVQRTVYPLADEKRAIALTVDQGDISAGGRSKSSSSWSAAPQRSCSMLRARSRRRCRRSSRSRASRSAIRATRRQAAGVDQGGGRQSRRWHEYARRLCRDRPRRPQAHHRERAGAAAERSGGRAPDARGLAAPAGSDGAIC
jgi:hypothetical protein